MSNRNYTEELRQHMQQLLELERAFYEEGFQEEKEHMKRKIQFMKETIFELENILNESTTERAPSVAEIVPEVIHEAVNNTEPPLEEKEETLVAFTVERKEEETEKVSVLTPPARVEKVPKPPRTPSPAELFLKNNLKLLVFASFLVVGIVWLFVYVTSLSELSEELRVLAGFGVSVAFISTAHIKKFTGNRAIALILVGYVVGLLVLLFGTIVLGVIPQLLAVVLSVLYVGYGLSQIIRLQAVVYDVAIILTSFLLTFAYRYVDAPHVVLYTYIAILLVALTVLLKNKGRLLSQYALILFSLGVTKIIGMGYDNEVYERNLFGQFDHSLNIQLTLLFPSILLGLASISTLFAKNEGENRWYPLLTGALYVAFFGYIFRMDALFIGEEIIFPFYLYLVLAGVSVLTYFFARKKQNEVIRNLGIVSIAVSSMYALASLEGHVSSLSIMLATSLTLLLMFYVGSKDRLYTLRGITLVYTFITLSKMSDLLYTFEGNESNALFVLANVLVLAGTLLASIPLLLKETLHESNETLKNLWVVLAKTRIVLHAFLMTLLINQASSTFLHVYEQPDAYRIGSFALVAFILYLFSKRFIQVELLWFTYVYLYVTAFYSMYELQFLELNGLRTFFISVVGLLFIVMLSYSKRPVFDALPLYQEVQRIIERIHRTIALVLIVPLSLFLVNVIDFYLTLENGLLGFVTVLIALGLFVRGGVKQEVATKTIAILYSFVASSFVFFNFSTNDFKFEHMLNWHLLNLVLLLVVFGWNVLFFKKEEQKAFIDFPADKPIKGRENWNTFLHRAWLPIAFVESLILIDLYASQLIDVNQWSDNLLSVILLLLTLGGWIVAKKADRFTLSLLTFFYLIRSGSFIVENISIWGEQQSKIVGTETLLGLVLIGVVYLLAEQVHQFIQQRKTNGIMWMGNFMMMGYLILLALLAKKFGLLLESHSNYDFHYLSPTVFVWFGAFYVLSFLKKEIPHYTPLRWFVELGTAFVLFSSTFNGGYWFSEEKEIHFGIILMELLALAALIFINYQIIHRYQHMKLESIFTAFTERTIYWLSVPFTLLTIYVGMHIFDLFLFQSENITANGIVGLSIVYLLYEIAKAEKVTPKLKGLIISLYTIAALYMSYLIFVLLADTSFIVRALIFIAIGVYGLFTAMKKNK